ncbi:COL10A [Mytilus coruscus]|uniref:COL10A n=1 Tax=Mytilus coruscus TaxID=42192 RepID=A0A6J8ASV5_MYTCO|nr:COL10A [Mytilus coruscus]
MAKMLLFRVLSISFSIVVSGSSSVGSDSESLLICSKFHFEEKVLEKLVRLEHKMEINEEKMKGWEVKLESLSSKIDEQMRKWEDAFLSKLVKMDEAVDQTETFVKSMRDFQLQEQSRINDSYQESVENFRNRSKSDSEIYGEQINAMLESMSSKIEEVSVAEKKRHNTLELMQFTLRQEQIRFNQSFDRILENTKLRSTKTINELFAKQQKVAVTACVLLSQTFPGNVVRFSTVKFQVGIYNLDTFKSSGKFVCEIPGLYYISAHIYTDTKGDAFYVKKNDVTIASSVSDSTSTYATNPISAVVELLLKDTLYIYAPHFIYDSLSCLSIMKVSV